MRFVAIFQFILLWQTMELNTFFVKHIFPMPTEHPICVTRILLMGLMAAPATRYALCSMHRPEQTKILIDIHFHGKVIDTLSRSYNFHNF